MNPLAGFMRARSRRSAERLDREFLAPAQEILTTPASPLLRNIALTICLFFFIGLLVTWFGHIDIYAVAVGRVQPPGRSKVIQPLDAGRVTAIDVRNGSFVHAGQTLIELDRTELSATATAVSEQDRALTAEIARRKLEIAAAGTRRLLPVPRLPSAGLDAEYRAREQAVLGSDLEALNASVDGLQAKIGENSSQRQAAEATAAVVRRVIDSLEARVTMLQGLVAQGWESRANLLDATQQLEREQASLSQTLGEISQAEAARRTLRSQIDELITKFVSDNSQAMSTSQTKLDQTRQDLVKAVSGVRRTRLFAPLDGTIQELDVTTVGQVVNSGQQLMIVVPRRGQLEIEALVPNKDIGFIRVGQPTVIKFDAFPFTRYGTASGSVVRVSRDAVANTEASQEAGAEANPIAAHSASASPDPKTQDLVFPVTVRMDRTTIDVDGRPMPLTSGLSATVEIRTGSRRVLEYILSPLVEVASQAGHER